jgi:hypothetical protein
MAVAMAVASSAVCVRLAGGFGNGLLGMGWRGAVRSWAVRNRHNVEKLVGVVALVDVKSAIAT